MFRFYFRFFHYEKESTTLALLNYGRNLISLEFRDYYGEREFHRDSLLVRFVFGGEVSSTT